MTSDSSAVHTFSFLILEVPNLYWSGVCFIHSSINLFRMSELNAFVPALTPRLSKLLAPNFAPNFTKFPSKLPPCSVFQVRCSLVVLLFYFFCGKFL